MEMGLMGGWLTVETAPLVTLYDSEPEFILFLIVSCNLSPTSDVTV